MAKTGGARWRGGWGGRAEWAVGGMGWALTLCLLAAPAGAQLVAVDSSSDAAVYAVGEDGLIKSIDGGATWMLVGQGLHQKGISALAIDRHAPSTLYAATRFEGIFKSTYGGGTWRAINDGLPDTRIGVLLIDPRTPSTIYAASQKGISKSLDAGERWTPMNDGLTSTIVFGLAIDPRNSSVLYAATYGGVFKSTDAGQHWENASSGLRYPTTLSVAVDARTPQTIYAGTNAGLQRSTDGGGTWQAIEALGTANPVSGMVVDPANDTVYAVRGERQFISTNGVFKSTDQGLTWQQIDRGLGEGPFGAVAVSPAAPQVLYVWTRSGFFRSADGGGSWKHLDTTPRAVKVVAPPAEGVPQELFGGTRARGVRVQNLAIDPLAPQRVYAATWRGVFRTTDGGARWQALPIPPVTGELVLGFAFDSGHPGTLYAFNGKPRIAKSIDAGEVWADASNGLPRASVFAVVVDPRASDVLYAGLPGGMWKSTDGGASWRALGGAPNAINVIKAIPVDADSPALLYAGTNGGGVFRSADGGDTWREINAGLVDWSGNRPEVYALAVDADRPRILYAGTGLNGVVKSTDGGEHWVSASDGLGGGVVRALVARPDRAGALYAATGRGVFKTTDGAQHWSAPNPRFTGFDVASLVIDPQVPSTLYAATTLGGVLKTVDAGRSWRAANDGLPSEP